MNIYFWVLVCAALFVLIIYEIYLRIYFSSGDFIEIRNNLSVHTNKCNDLNDHIERLKSAYVNVRAQDHGVGSISNPSRYNMKRSRWSEEKVCHQIHRCSASVWKNASNSPIKYLCKYFNIEINRETLASFEGVLNSFSAAEQGTTLLRAERDSIVSSVEQSIPREILFFSKSRVVRELGFNPIDFSDLHLPVYTFQYVSAGGNSSSRLDIKLDLQNLDRLVSHLGSKLDLKNSIAGQRSLMTSALRERIKIRDRFTCQICNLSTDDEKNLLLEIDHIVPLSRGGITSEQNLQTLCWKCNRAKGAKLLSSSQIATHRSLAAQMSYSKTELEPLGDHDPVLSTVTAPTSLTSFGKNPTESYPHPLRPPAYSSRHPARGASAEASDEAREDTASAGRVTQTRAAGRTLVRRG